MFLIFSTLSITSIISEEKIPILSFKETKIDFGTIKAKKKPLIIVDFDFQNTGEVPLVIIKADVSCNCLSVEYPRKPVMPEEKGKISVTIDTKSQKGEFNKTVVIKSNDENEFVVLRISGTIK